MLSIGGAAAIAGEQYLAAAAQRGDAELRHRLDHAGEIGIGDDRADDGGALAQFSGDEILQSSLQPSVPCFVKWQFLTCPSVLPKALITDIRLTGSTSNIV